MDDALVAEAGLDLGSLGGTLGFLLRLAQNSLASRKISSCVTVHTIVAIGNGSTSSQTICCHR